MIKVEEIAEQRQPYKARVTTLYLKESDISRLNDLRKRLMRMEKESTYALLVATGICLLYRLSDAELAVAVTCTERERRIEEDHRNLPDEIYVRTKMITDLKKKLEKLGFSEKDLANEERRNQMLQIFDEESKKQFSKSKIWKDVLNREKAEEK